MPEQQPTAGNRRTQKAVPEPLGPDSYIWQDFGHYLFHFMLPQAFAMQVAHPTIDAGVGQHSVYKTDPWGRAKRSTEMLWPVVYARPEVAVQKGIELRELHRAIKGTDKQGKRYNALNPEAYGWVHGTGFDAMVRMHELFGTPPGPEKRAQMFEEWRRMGLMLGLREEDLPRTEEAYWEYFEDMIQNRLEIGEVASDLLGKTYYLEIPRPPGSSVPEPVWKLMLHLVSPVARLNLRGTLPESFRERFGIKWSRTDEIAFRALRRGVRAVVGLLPEKRRYIPLAWEAIDDARKHPQAYRWEEETSQAALAG